MDIKRSYLGQEVLGKGFDGVAEIVDFHVSDANRFYVDVENNDGKFHVPLDLVVPYLHEQNDPYFD